MGECRITDSGDGQPRQNEDRIRISDRRRDLNNVELSALGGRIVELILKSRESDHVGVWGVVAEEVGVESFEVNPAVGVDGSLHDTGPGVDGLMQFLDARFRRSTHSRLRGTENALGSQMGHEATAEALAYGWEHWDQVSAMANPAGYLYKVGRDMGRRQFRRRPPILLSSPDPMRLPAVEPGLIAALEVLPERQRVAVMLIRSFGWSLSEVADHLGIAKGTVQTHLRRGMGALRRELGVNE